MVSITDIGYGLFVIGVIGVVMSFQYHSDMWGRYAGWSVSRFWLVVTILGLGIVGIEYVP